MFSVRSAHIGKSLSAKRFFNLLRLICIYAGFMRKYTVSLYDYSLLGLYLMLFCGRKYAEKPGLNRYLFRNRASGSLLWPRSVIHGIGV